MNDKAKLIHSWEVDGIGYRLIALADFTPGYEDKYVVERRHEDALGGACWKTYNQYKPNDDCDRREITLVHAIKQLCEHAKRHSIPTAKEGRSP